MELSNLGVLVLGLCCTLHVVWGQGYVNIATGKTYDQSSTWSSTSFSHNAADGITDTAPYFQSKLQYNPYWEVDLGRVYAVEDIVVWGRLSISSHLYPFNITVDGQHCVTVNSAQTSNMNISVTCSSLLYGQTVRLTRTATGPSYLILSEFEILVPRGDRRCDEGRWGPQCQYYCDNNCGGRAGTNFCYQSTVNCYDECVAGRWGDQCQNRCSHNCITGDCDLKTGNCSACIAGWYGGRCDTRCPSQRCLLITCDQTTGRCLACNSGFAGDNCTACVDGRWGEQCQHSCRVTCVNTTCDRDTGICTVQKETTEQKTVIDMEKLIVSVVGSIVGVGLFLTISLTAVICWSNRKREKSVSTDKADDYYSTLNPVLMRGDTDRRLPDLPSSSPSSQNGENTEPKTVHTANADDGYTHPKTIHTANADDDYTHPKTIHTDNTDEHNTQSKTVRTERKDRQASRTQEAGKHNTEGTDHDHIYNSIENEETTF